MIFYRAAPGGILVSCILHERMLPQRRPINDDELPPALLDILRLRAGAKVGLAVERGRLIVEPRQRPHYSLDELLAQCNPRAPRGRKDREWLDAKPVGGELL